MKHKDAARTSRHYRFLLLRTVCSRARGLLGRVELDPRIGVILAPCSAIHTFGMRMAIDVVFLDSAGRRLVVKRSLAPGRLLRCGPARYAVEMAADAAPHSDMAWHAWNAALWRTLGDAGMLKRVPNVGGSIL